MHCLRDGAGDHARQYHRLLLSLQRSPGLDVVSILLVGPPPWVRRALSDRMAHRSRKKLQVAFDPVFFLSYRTVRGPTPTLYRYRIIARVDTLTTSRAVQGL